MNTTTTTGEMFIAAAFLGLMVLTLIPAVFMWVSLAKQGDERRKMILSKTCTNTLIIYTITLLIDVVGSFFSSDIFDPLSSDYIHLAVIGILFTINLFLTKKKYGD